MSGARLTVLVSSPIHPAGLQRLRESVDLIEQHHLYERTDLRALDAALARADAVIVRSLPVTEAILARSPRLQIVAKHGAGLNTIDIDAATRFGVVVSSTGGTNALGVAEGTVALMLAVVRRIVEMHALVAEGRFSERTKLEPFDDLAGKTLGVIGFGNIGRQVARICRDGFGMDVIAFDPTVDAARIEADGATAARSLHALLGAADIVTLHVPLIPSTRAMIGAAQLAAMKPHAVLVNTSRGPVVDGAALADALERGALRGAALDVFDPEPPGRDDRLLRLPNVVLSPHVAGVTESAQRQTALEAAEAVLEVLAGRPPRHFANATVWPNRRGGDR
jgi:phosphoglycerate dehydrogenase-like enzyme